MNDVQHRGGTTVTKLTCEHQTDPLGIDVQQPRLGWQLSSGNRGVTQRRYQVLVGTDRDLVDRDELAWNSGVVESDQSVDIEYQGDPLRSRQRYFWTVRSWVGDEPTAWATPASWEMGLLEAADWSARWVEPGQRPAQPEPPLTFTLEDPSVLGQVPVHHELLNPAQLIRKTFPVRPNVERARIYATAHGVYTLELNGQKVGDRELAPDFTAYDKYLMYQTYDVTDLLNPGANALGATVADGWYAGRLGLTGASVNYGDKLGLLLQLEITYTGGTIETIGSDDSFTSATGAIQYADLLIGEKHDARLNQKGWSSAQFADPGWRNVTVADYSYENLVAQYGEPIRVVQTLPAKAVLISQAGEHILDFGQNVAGRVRMRVSGPRGTEVTLAHSQTLDADGNFFSNILGANNENTDVYILGGEGTEIFEPQFTYHGFRYVKVTGYPGELDPENFTALAMSSDSPVVLEFETSDPTLNQLQSNIRWTLLDNYFSVPTDNPDRERAGWTGDLEAIAPTSTLNFGLQSFLTRWLRNMVLDQLDDGQIPLVIPYFEGYRKLSDTTGSHSCAAWGDVSVITPWTLYNVYGDRRILEETYEAGKRWLDYVSRTAKTTLTEEDAADPDLRYLWRAVAFHFGDWLTPSQTTVSEAGLYDVTSGFNTMEYVPTLYYAHSAQLLSEIAAVLGRSDESAAYAELSEHVRRAFRKAFVRSDGMLTRDLQGMYVLALQFDMVPDEQRGRLLERLVELISKNGGRLDTGFLSTPFVLPLLSENGYNDLAYSIIFGEENPSWFYQVKNGATTVWEMWDSIQTSGNVTKTSQNQPGLTTVGNWLYRFVGGIDAAAPGYKRINIGPRRSEQLSSARVQYESNYGRIASSWERSSGQTRLAVSIPGNTTASVRLDGATLGNVTEGGSALRGRDGILSVRQAEGAVVVEVGSGDYVFGYAG
jgi:alpha-L-rhamnosidase